MTEICKTINAHKLDPVIFRKALEAVTRSRPTGRFSLEEKMRSCLEVVQASSLPESKKSITALAIHFRLEALATFLAAGGAQGFRHKGIHGSDRLDPSIVICAAIEPIIGGSDQVTFDISGFEQRLLTIVEPSDQYNRLDHLSALMATHGAPSDSLQTSKRPFTD